MQAAGHLSTMFSAINGNFGIDCQRFNQRHNISHLSSKLNLSVGTATYEFSLTNTADQTGERRKTITAPWPRPECNPHHPRPVSREATTPTDWSVQGLTKAPQFRRRQPVQSPEERTITTTIQQAVQERQRLDLSYTKIQDDNSSSALLAHLNLE